MKVFNIDLTSFVIFAVLVFASVGFLPSQAAPPSTPEEGIAKPSSGQNGGGKSQTNDGKETPTDVPPAAQQPPSPPCDVACQQGRQNIAIQGKLERFTLGLVVVGFLQVGTMVWQGILSKKTRDDVHDQVGQMKIQTDLLNTQARQIGEQIAIQKATLLQWVEVTNLEATCPYLNTTTSQATLTVSFDIGNPTKMPLILKSVLADSGPIWEEGHGVESMSMLYTLAPDNPFPIKVEIPMSGWVLARYRSRQLPVVLTVDVEFVDAFKDIQKQRMVFSGKCGPTDWCEFAVSQSTHAKQEASDTK